MRLIERYIGIPYKKDGRDFSGCDCFGLVYLFYKHEFNCELPDYRYGVNEVFKYFKKVSVHDVVLGDVLIVDFVHEKHTAIVINRFQMLHNISRANSCIGRIGQYLPYIQGAYRLCV